MRNNQSGRSMIEMLGVLAIIGVLSVGGIAGYSKAMAKYRSNKVMEQISMFVTNTRTMYAQQQTYMNFGLYFAKALFSAFLLLRKSRNTGTSLSAIFLFWT